MVVDSHPSPPNSHKHPATHGRCNVPAHGVQGAPGWQYTPTDTGDELSDQLSSLVMSAEGETEQTQKLQDRI